MSESKHEQWTYTAHDDGDRVVRTISAGCIPVLTYTQYHDLHDADRIEATDRRFRLATAAPQMLEALRALTAMAALVPMAPIEKYHEVMASARAAIAAATGGEQ